MFGENRVSLPHSDRMSSTTPYIRYVGSRGEPHFLSTVHLFSNS
jgi:hypothetical protein